MQRHEVGAADQAQEERDVGGTERINVPHEDRVDAGQRLVEREQAHVVEDARLRLLVDAELVCHAQLRQARNLCPRLQHAHVASALGLESLEVLDQVV